MHLNHPSVIRSILYILLCLCYYSKLDFHTWLPNVSFRSTKVMFDCHSCSNMSQFLYSFHLIWFSQCWSYPLFFGILIDCLLSSFHYKYRKNNWVPWILGLPQISLYFYLIAMFIMPEVHVSLCCSSHSITVFSYMFLPL